jgi:ssRNA-specific RNase YbeY (16S rRNA maturation enzyme)
MRGSVSVTNKTRVRAPRKLFAAIKDAALGPNYELSVALLNPAEMLRVTRERKHKDHVSNVLSFPLSKTSGEILLCPQAAKPYTLPYLFIHGCLHLKGQKHGATMERNEQALLARFTPSYAKDSNGNRRRDLPGEGGHRRASR